MIYGFKHRALTEIPKWAGNLHFPYWMIRVEGRNKAKRRRYYRAVLKEKIRLVESGIPIEHVNAVCKYLVSHRKSSADNLDKVLAEPVRQLQLNFIITFK
ncbi:MULTISPECIES: hypothetical protein [Methylotenera]|uniref:hypothetical protein n=1 Tax=Methylotenera TaxID=359407 RepID=UPI000371D736|nr:MULTISPECIES: hypothetical protein [Methylotenera]